MKIVLQLEERQVQKCRLNLRIELGRPTACPDTCVVRTPACWLVYAICIYSALP